jgi:hypothetical protein
MSSNGGRSCQPHVRGWAGGRTPSGLALLDAPGVSDISEYPYVHLVRGALLEELGRHGTSLETWIDHGLRFVQQRYARSKRSLAGVGGGIRISM